MSYTKNAWIGVCTFIRIDVMRYTKKCLHWSPHSFPQQFEGGEAFNVENMWQPRPTKRDIKYLKPRTSSLRRNGLYL